MIPVLMKHHGFDLQTAVDFIGMMCLQCIANFVEDHEKIKKIPFGKEVEEMIAKYVDGLQNWMVGKCCILILRLSTPN